MRRKGSLVVIFLLVEKISQRIQVGQCTDSTAFFSYDRPAGKTGARSLEAIVVQINPDGNSFTGIERVTISKLGEGSFRAQATYVLNGTKQ